MLPLQSTTFAPPYLINCLTCKLFSNALIYFYVKLQSYLIIVVFEKIFGGTKFKNC